MVEYGLIGRGIGHSFSANYFNTKFARECIAANYSLFDLSDITMLPTLLDSHPGLKGLNVTSPYKRDVIKYLDSLSPEAEALGAVNVVEFQEDPDGGRILRGHNSDYGGFKKTLSEIGSEVREAPALVLGTGGASSAVQLALKTEGIGFKVVSRHPEGEEISYDEANCLLPSCSLVVNATPVGMAPNVNAAPDIDYDRITPRHFFYDLIYNPSETQFLKRAAARGARVLNGLPMLLNQAELSWKIWNER